ncbi:hypothetical protein D3C73_1071260 [compost metagenome]
MRYCSVFLIPTLTLKSPLVLPVPFLNRLNAGPLMLLTVSRLSLRPVEWRSYLKRITTHLPSSIHVVSLSTRSRCIVRKFVSYLVLRLQCFVTLSLPTTTSSQNGQMTTASRVFLPKAGIQFYSGAVQTMSIAQRELAISSYCSKITD